MGTIVDLNASLTLAAIMPMLCQLQMLIKVLQQSDLHMLDFVHAIKHVCNVIAELPQG